MLANIFINLLWLLGIVIVSAVIIIIVKSVINEISKNKGEK